ncbi:MAG: exopolyphosphatase [Gammaproteobacteria bacterium]|nr:MAG: exopolyphosphatase [Gammaproteobacteria bacterium]
MDSTPVTCAVGDLGSNTFHLMIATVSGPRINIIDRIREPVRLAAGFDEYGALNEEAQERAFRCMELFGQRLKGFPPEHVLMVGTNALRKAVNSREFIENASSILGYEIEVVSGYEEARLVFAGIARNIEPDNRKRLIIDIGGGSTEFAIGRRFEPFLVESIDVGCLSTKVNCFADGKVTERRMHDAIIAAGLKLQPILSRLKGCGWSSAFGSSGSVKSIAQVVYANGWCDEGISYESLKILKAQLIRDGVFKAEFFPDISSDRADVFPGGVAVLFAIMKNLDIDHVYISDGGIREGMLLDLSGRIDHKDVRDTSVSVFANSYGVDRDQADRVFAKAEFLYRNVKDNWGLDEQICHDLLRWSADVHEVGLSISHGRYHKHSAYLVRHSNLAGFSREIQMLLGFIVRCHRKSFSEKSHEKLPLDFRDRAVRLCVILRLAVILCRSRNDVDKGKLKVESGENRIKICFPGGWLQDNPLTEADLLLEVDYLQQIGWQLIFE